MCCCMIKTSLVLTQKSLFIFEHLRQSLEIFKNVRECLSGLRTTFEASSEIFGKCSDIFDKLSKQLLLVCSYNKQNNTWLLVSS